LATISMTLYQDLNCIHKSQPKAVKPVTGLAVASVPSQLPAATKPLGTTTEDLEYEVFCPNCARGEMASTHDMVKHLCNCGYGVFVEMLRTSPN
jgi:hypothetical protein